MTKGSKCLVLDADIARAAGGENTKDERSKSCRDFLTVVQDTQHKVVSTEAIRSEWRTHQSRFTTAWFVSMLAQKKICWINAPADNDLRRKVEYATMSEKKRAAMLKDVHLIEAAFQADRIVISMDETVRQYFHEATHSIGILKQVAWVNPCKGEETPIDWLRDGAELEKDRFLGYPRKSTTTE